MAIFGCTLQTVTTESDPLRAFRAALKRCREELGLTPTEAAERAGISAQRWSAIERGYEIKSGVRIPANPRRANLIKMARAVEIPVDEALRLAGLGGLTVVESRLITDNPRRELAQLIKELPGPDVQLLLDVAKRLSYAVAGHDSAVHFAERTVDTPQETPPPVPASRESDEDDDVTP